LPVVFRQDGVRFFFYSNEGNPREPLHVHAMRGDAEAKIWLEPDVSVASSTGFSRAELADLLKMVADRRKEIERAWNDHFG